MRSKKIKICFTSSSGGHFEQLIMLRPLMEEYDSYIVTEKLDYDITVGQIPIKHVVQINRTDSYFFLKFLFNIIKSLIIVIVNRPTITISTGALASIPLIVWTKLFGGKVIYIESFAKIDSPNISGRIAYKFADQFYIQWESMRKFYPKAMFKGGIY